MNAPATEDYTELAENVINSAFLDLAAVVEAVRRGRCRGYMRCGHHGWTNWYQPLVWLEADMEWFSPTGDYWLWVQALDYDAEQASVIADEFMRRAEPVKRRLLELAKVISL